MNFNKFITDLSEKAIDIKMIIKFQNYPQNFPFFSFSK